MSQPIAYLNGRFIPEDQLSVAPYDLGFMWGVTVAEQFRTFRGELFLAKQHLDRLRVGLDCVQVDALVESLERVARELVAHNWQLLGDEADLGVTIFVTPGHAKTYDPDGHAQPTVGVHTYPLPFSLWADKYETGQRCGVSSVRQVPTTSWPRAVKARSRLHYYLADQEVGERFPGARAILLDEHDNVNEASTANVVLHLPNEGLVSPPLEDILPGVSLRYVAVLAKELGIPFVHRTTAAHELELADEILLTSTPFCLLPVSQLGNRTLTSRQQFEALLSRWSETVGVDIPQQARANR